MQVEGVIHPSRTGVDSIYNLPFCTDEMSYNETYAGQKEEWMQD